MKSCYLTIRITPELIAEIKDAAAQAGVTYSAWVTAACQEKLIGAGNPNWRLKVLEAIRRIEPTPAKSRRSK